MKQLYKEQTFQLRISDFSYNDYITPHALLEYFQQLAVSHAIDMKVGAFDLDKRNLHFVITKMRFTLYKSPSVDSEIKVITYPKPAGKLYFYRDYELRDLKTDELLGICSSQWLLIDRLTSKVCRSNTLSYEGIHLEKSAYEEEIEKLDFSNKSLEKVFSYKILLSDIDRNMHVNNTKYAKIVLDSFDNLDDFKVKDFTINYMTEIKKDDVIDIYKHKDNDTYYFLGKKEEVICFAVKVKI